ncbi:MAG TPA: hypothetical protein VL996_10480, partial [Methylocella sp.]|nr:hypothetical protein [Methylocella sp.]
MGWDDQFNLIEDGDPYERLWWPLLKDHFSEWERFWKHHVVPLTNRIDEKIKPFDAKKRFLRRDDKINTDIEMMAMRSYSVFYYLARASTIILFEPHLFIEDAFFYL